MAHPGASTAGNLEEHTVTGHLVEAMADEAALAFAALPAEDAAAKASARSADHSGGHGSDVDAFFNDPVGGGAAGGGGGATIVPAAPPTGPPFVRRATALRDALPNVQADMFTCRRTELVRKPVDELEHGLHWYVLYTMVHSAALQQATRGQIFVCDVGVIQVHHRFQKSLDSSDETRDRFPKCMNWVMYTPRNY